MRLAVMAGLVLSAFMISSPAPAHAQAAANSDAACRDFRSASESRIAACTHLIEAPGATDAATAHWRLFRALAYLEAQRYAEAEADAYHAAHSGRLSPMWRGEAFVLLGRGRSGRGDPAGALEAYEQAIALVADYGPYYMLIADAHGQMGDYARAVENADIAAQLQPREGAPQNARCWWRAAANVDLATARAACDRALAAAADDSTRVAVLDSRGLVNLRERKWAEAWTDYDAAVRLQPDSAHALYGRGVAAIRAGRTTAGQADIAAAIGLDPEISATYARFGIRP